MISNNIFHDICAEPSNINHVLQRLDITSSLSDSNLSIVNYECKNAFQNKLQKIFFKHLTNYYEESSVTLFEVLKHQICQTLIITNYDSFVGGAIYVISPTEGSFVFFLHINKDYKKKGIGTTLLQIIQKGTITKLKTNNMLIWIEVRPHQQHQQQNTDISAYYKKLGFHLTNPTNHEIQYIIPPTVLKIINNTDSYSHIMRCTKPIQKQEQIRRAINQFTNGKCDMCQASGCILVCEYKMNNSHNKLDDEKQLHSICGTSLCMTCQTGFGLTVNNRCNIHKFAINKKSPQITDSQYKNYIKNFISKSKEENKDINVYSGFWADPQDICDTKFKYCRHCRIYDGNDFDKSSFEQIPLRIKENQSNDWCILTHPTDMYFYNNMHELQLDQDVLCFQYKKKLHSNYFDSNLGSVKSILTNTFFEIKHVTGIGDCGFLCLMIGINSCKEIRLKFNKNVEEFYKNELGKTGIKKKTSSDNIEDFKEIFMQMHKLKFTKPNSDVMDMEQVKDDYQQTETLSDLFHEWVDAFEKSQKKSLKKLHYKWLNRFKKTTIQDTANNYYMTNNDFVRFIEYFKIGIVFIKDYANPDQQFKDGKYFISDCNFNAIKQKHIFTYCDYFMIIGYFDKIHFDLFYNQQTKKAIYPTKKGKERDFVRRLCDEQNLFYFFGETNENKSDYERGWDSFSEKHKKISVVDKDNYVNNKWMDIADGVEISEDKEYKHEAVFLIESNFDVTTCPPYIKATHKTSKNVTFYDVSYYVIVDVPETKFNYIKNTTSAMTLIMKKYLWYQKLRLEIDNDGIHINKYLYENTGFTWKTPATTISLFYKSQMDMVYTYEEKINMWIKSQVAMNPTFRSYTDFHNTFEAIKFTIHFYDKNNVAKNFQICGIDMYDFSSYKYNFIYSQNDENKTSNATSQNDEKKNILVSDIEKKLSQYFTSVYVEVEQKAPNGPPPGAQASPPEPVLPNVKHVIAIASGKGGVGKSTVASNIACGLIEKGYKVGLLDLDIYGPSLPITLGINEQPEMTDNKKLVPINRFGLKVMSFGFISG